MERNEMMNLIEDKFLDTEPGDFNSIDHALIVAASALQYLAAQCEVEDDPDGGTLDPADEFKYDDIESFGEVEDEASS